MCSYRGIKGASVLSEFVKIPEQVLLDKMHTTARGAQEVLNNLWLNPNLVINLRKLALLYSEFKSI